MQTITDDVGRGDKSSGGAGGGGKISAKEKFTRFYDLLEEVVERHRMAKVLEEDREAREVVADEIVLLVVPSLKRFMQKQKEKEFSRSEPHFLYPPPSLVYVGGKMLTWIGFFFSPSFAFLYDCGG